MPEPGRSIANPSHWTKPGSEPDSLGKWMISGISRDYSLPTTNRSQIAQPSALATLVRTT
jgi:hypothetical protein